MKTKEVSAVDFGSERLSILFFFEENPDSGICCWRRIWVGSRLARKPVPRQSSFLGTEGRSLSLPPPLLLTVAGPPGEGGVPEEGTEALGDSGPRQRMAL